MQQPHEYDYDVFLLHRAFDGGWVAELCSHLTAHGLRVLAATAEALFEGANSAALLASAQSSAGLLDAHTGRSAGARNGQEEAFIQRFKEGWDRDRRYAMLRDKDHHGSPRVSFPMEPISSAMERLATFEEILDLFSPPSNESFLPGTSPVCAVGPDSRFHWNWAIPSPVLAAAMSLDGRLTVIACEDRGIRVMDSGTGVCLKELATGGGAITCLDLSPDGKFVLVGDSNGLVQLWNLRTGKCRLNHRMSKQITVVKLHPSRKWALMGNVIGGMEFIALESSLFSREMHFSSRPISSLAFTPQMETMLVGHKDGLTARRLDHGGFGSEIEIFGGWTSALTVSQDGRRVAFGDENGRIHLWDTVDRVMVLSMEGHRSRLRFLALSDTTEIGITGDESGMIFVWDLQMGEAIRSYDLLKGPVMALWMDAQGSCFQAIDGNGAVLAGRIGK